MILLVLIYFFELAVILKQMFRQINLTDSQNLQYVRVNWTNK